MDINEYENNIRDKLTSISYTSKKNDFLCFNIYASWWSKYTSPSKPIQLRYRRFLQLIRIFPDFFNDLCKNKKFIQLCNTDENITKIIQISKSILKEEFKKKSLRKQNLYLN